MSLVENSLVWDVDEEDADARHFSRIRIRNNENSSIRSNAFVGVFTLTYVELCIGIIRIGNFAFSRCSNLRECVIPNSVRSIGKSAFTFCRSLQTVALPPRIETIESNTFYGCESLTNVDIPQSVGVIRLYAFQGCESLIYVELPSKLLLLEEGAFADCVSLSGILIPKDATIERWVFEGCSALQSIEIHDDTQNPDDFEGCDILSNVYLPHERPIFEDSDDENEADWGGTLLLATFPDVEDLTHRLRTRFHGLPIHRLCYFQGHGPKKTSLASLGASLSLGVEQYYPTLHKPDKLGMTPLHILALSQRPNVELCAQVVDLSPETTQGMLGIEDQFGVAALEYSIRNRAPGAGSIVCFLFGLLVEAEINNTLGLKKWKAEIMEKVSVLEVADLSPDERRAQMKEINRIQQVLEMMERSSLLETVLWKRSIDSTEHARETDHNSAGREWCRVHCGAQIIIPQVMAYL